MRIVKVAIMLGAFAGLTGAFFGCGTARPNAASGDGTVGPNSESCSTPGATRVCKFVVSEVNDVRTCAEGSQTCVNGYWGPCSGNARGGPTLLQSVSLKPAANGGLSIRNINPPSDAGPACANPCDPACTGYNEACSGDAGADAGDAGSMTTFPATSYPACAASAPGIGATCDCTGAGTTCGNLCNSLGGCEMIGRGGKTTDFECNSVSGLCEVKCESGANCNVDCNSVGTCSTTCLTGSTCDVRCNSVSSCVLNCAPGANCTISYCNSATCLTNSLAQPGACLSTPPFQLPNVIAPGANAGHLNTLLDDPCRPGGSSARCEISAFGTTVDDGRMASTCNADTYCDTSATSPPGGCCQPFTTGQTHASVAAGGLQCASALPDLTMNGVCRTPSGDIALMMCNRGSAAATGPIWMGSTNPNFAPTNAGTAAAPTCAAIGAANYVCRYDGTILPGACAIILDTAPLGAGCGGNLPNGNAGVMLNGPDAPNVVAECDLDVKDTVSALQPTQPGCANNLHAFGAGGQIPDCLGGYTPTQITEVYTASCNPGQRPKWTTLGWQAVTPGTGAQRSNIEFYATIEGTDYDGGPLAPVGPQMIGKAWTGPATPQAVPPNYTNYVQGPASCRPDVPTSPPPANTPICPKNLANTIGAAAPVGAGPNVLYGEKLTLDIYLNPSPNGAVVPTLSNWWISYTCVDYE